MSRSRATTRKPLDVFVLQAAALGLLLLFLPGMDGVYPTAFNAHANVLFQSFGEKRHLRFKTLPPESRNDRADSRMNGYGRHSDRPQWRLIYRITSRGWWPTAILIGLLVATPLPWLRRIGTLLAGLLILDALILARLASMAVMLYGASEPVPVERWVRARGPLTESFNSWVPPVASVLLAWVAVARPSSTIDGRASGTRLGRLLFGLRPRGAGPGEGAGSGEDIGDGHAGGGGEEGERHS